MIITLGDSCSFDKDLLLGQLRAKCPTGDCLDAHYVRCTREERETTGCALTLVVVDGLLHEAGLSRGNPQRKTRLLEAEAKQILGPISHLPHVAGILPI